MILPEGVEEMKDHPTPGLEVYCGECRIRWWEGRGVRPHLMGMLQLDERGVPKGVNAKWRQDETKHWLQVGYKNAKKNKSTIISGISMPDEILERLDKRRNIKVQFCLLNHSNWRAG